MATTNASAPKGHGIDIEAQEDLSQPPSVSCVLPTYSHQAGSVNGTQRRGRKRDT